MIQSRLLTSHSDGTVIAVSSYELHLDTTGITMKPISFSNVILFVKGTKEGSGAITTGLGCGLPPYQAPCDLLFAGGPSSAGFTLAPCARLNKEQDWTQTCISIDSSATAILDREEFKFCLS